jgi:hypothetical protein
MSDHEGNSFDSESASHSSQPNPSPPVSNTREVYEANGVELGGETQPEADWVSEDAMESLILERTINPSESAEDLSRRLIRENLPVVTQSMIHLAIHSASETTRLRAGQYLVDRMLGKPGDDLKSQGEDPLGDLLSELTKAAEQHANSSST